MRFMDYFFMIGGCDVIILPSELSPLKRKRQIVQNKAFSKPFYSSGCTVTPFFYFRFRKSVIWRCDFLNNIFDQYIMTSSYYRFNQILKNVKFPVISKLLLMITCPPKFHSSPDSTHHYIRCIYTNKHESFRL